MDCIVQNAKSSSPRDDLDAVPKSGSSERRVAVLCNFFKNRIA